MSHKDEEFPLKVWTYRVGVGIPLWIGRIFHKIGEEEKLESLAYGTIYPGDKVCERKGVMWVEKKT